MPFNILTLYWFICYFHEKKKVEVICVIILFYNLIINIQITCVAKVFVIISRSCVVCPPRSV